MTHLEITMGEIRIEINCDDVEGGYVWRAGLEAWRWAITAVTEPQTVDIEPPEWEIVAPSPGEVSVEETPPSDVEICHGCGGMKFRNELCPQCTSGPAILQDTVEETLP